MTKEQVIKDLLELADGMDKKKFQELTGEIFEESLKRLLENRKPEDVTPIREIVNKIFEICPECNFVPLAYSYNDYTDIITEKDWEELIDLSEHYINIEYHQIPVQNDNMTIGKAKEMYRLWEEASKKCYVQEGTDRNGGDYTENCYYDIIGYDRKKDEIITLYDVNH